MIQIPTNAPLLGEILTGFIRNEVHKTGLSKAVVGLSGGVDSALSAMRFPDVDARRRGNKMARERMTILYDHSARWNGLVIGTSNKTELLLGYGTLHGDMASAINPLGDLYKTQVWALAEAIGVPSVIVAKEPSADLWVGQTDEGELGFTYREVDNLLYMMVDQRCTKPELITLGFTETFIDRVALQIMTSQFKRRLPVIAKVSQRTIDRDFRYSRDWGK